MHKAQIPRPLLALEMSKKCAPLLREAHLSVKMFKTPHARTTFDASYVVFRLQEQGVAHLVKSANREGFAAGDTAKTMAGVGHLKTIFRVAGTVQETC